MKSHLLLLLPLISVSSAVGQTIQITHWQGNKAGAVCLTFDDSPANHWTNAAPIMTAAGVRGTFCVITSSVDWEGARTAALAGHEIGSHSTDGNPLDVLDFETAADRMQQSHAAIETEIGTAVPGYQCHVIAWPFGKRRLDVVNDPGYKDLYVSARNAGNTLLASNSVNAADVTSWWKFGEGTYQLDHYFVIGDALMGAGISLDTFNAQLDKVESENAWTVFTYHGIVDAGASGLSVDKADFADQVAALAARQQTTLWVAPYGEVVRYIRQRDAAVATVADNDGTTIALSLTDDLEDAVYNVPLTLSITAPEGWSHVSATQDDQPISVRLVDGTIFLDAVPDAGIIQIVNTPLRIPEIPVVAISPLDAATVQLSWNTETETSYEILESTDLSTWVSTDPPLTITGDGSRQGQPVSLTDSRVFFRVEAKATP